MRKIRKGDIVIVLSGKDRGKQGTVIQSLIDDSSVIVSGINLVKKHVKPNPLKGTEGGVISKEMPIHVSNVAIYNADNQKSDRVGFSVQDGKKTRISKSSSKPLEQ